MAKKNYYAVKNGRKIGIFTNWAECEAQVKGYKGASYEGFSTLSEAKAFLGDLYDESYKIAENVKLPPQGEIYAYVDGSFNIATKIYGYGAVLIFSNGEIKEFFGSGNNENAISMRNVAGELKGAFCAIQYAVNNRYNALTIHHDYEGISKWAEHKWKANLSETQAYQELCDKVRNYIELKFEKVDAHTGVLYNERADVLAKKAVGIGE